MPQPRHTELELPQNPDFQRREWFVQRVGWIVLCLVVGAGLLGLLGDGPMSAMTWQSPDRTLVVDTDRFLHRHDQSELTVQFAAADADEFTLYLGDEFQSRCEIQRITPEPIEEYSVSGEHALRFRSGSQAGQDVITVHFEPQRCGALAYEIRTDHTTLKIRQYVYP